MPAKKKVEAKAAISLSETPVHLTPHLNRLSRIKGQIMGIDKMIGQERHCADILIQIEAARSALRSLSTQLLEAHLHTSLEDAAQTKTGRDREKKIEELLEIFSRY